MYLFSISTSSPGVNKIHISKKDFDGSDAEKAYLLGFCLGDMNVAKKKYGETIYASSCTTKKEQVLLMKRLFKSFGHVHINESKRILKKGEISHFHFIVHLNSSFDFLLNKEDKIKNWVLRNKNYFLSFLGGYVDKRGVRTLKDLWSLRVRKKKELGKFINLIEPYLSHPKRKLDLLKVKNNLSLRLNIL